MRDLAQYFGLIQRNTLRCAAVLMGLALVTSAGCGGGSNPGPVCCSPPPPAPTSAWSLHAANDSSLTSYFRSALGPQSKSYGSGVWVTDIATAVSATSSAAMASGAPASVVSGTTLQEVGVDEADLIKSDGNSVFNLEQASAASSGKNVIRRQRLDAKAVDAALTPVDSLDLAFSSDVNSTGFYLDGERQQLAVVAEGQTVWGRYDAWFSSQYWGQGATEVSLVSTADATQMRKIRNLRMTAQLIGSRRVGSTLYLVMRSYPQVPGLDPTWPTATTEANQAVVNSLQSSQLLPTLSIDGAAAQPLVDAASCYTQDNNAVKSADIITVVGIDLAAATHRHAARCFTGGTEAFYLSDQSLYLATTRNDYTYNDAFPVYSGQTSTDVHKFALNGLDIAYRGSGNVTGHLGFDQNRKSFRMGEYQGALRVITQTATTWFGWLTLGVTGGSTGVASTSPAPADSPAHLTILKESAGELIRVSELPNAARPAPLGKAGEQLYASRFIGTRGYLVTYRLTDPLYVLDLSNPADPQVAGELQVSGYSDYLFPLTESLLLGVGKEALSDGSAGDGRFAWYQGVKLSLIDVRDPTHPREAARSIVGKRGTDATVLHDHHGIALQTSGNSVRVGLPVSLADTPSSYVTGAASDYYNFSRTELQKFEIDLSAQTLTARAPLASKDSGQRDISADRSLLWNDQVHYYQNGVWNSAAW